MRQRESLTIKEPKTPFGSSDQDHFGSSVALDGDVVVVGAFRDDGSAVDSGSVYVFEKPAGGWTGTVNHSAKLVSTAIQGSGRLGSSVAISGDTVVSGAPRDNNDVANSAQGSAQVFLKPVTGWGTTAMPVTVNQVAELLTTDRSNFDFIGTSVSIDGDTIAVGATDEDADDSNSGAVYLYKKPMTGWTNSNQTAKLIAAMAESQSNDRLGTSVDVSGDTVLSGAPEDDIDANANQGSAYIFVEPGGGWAGTVNHTAKLIASDGAASDRLGFSVAIDGNTVVIGAPGDDGNRGAAYATTEPVGGWASLVSPFSIDAMANKMTASDGQANDNFGHSVDVSGSTVVAGAWGDDTPDGIDENQGAAYVFSLNTPPTITATPVSVARDTTTANVPIATVDDVDQSEDTLTVTVDGGASATVNGVTVSNIVVASNGVVTATVAATCTATDATFTLTVTDSQGATASAMLTVTVTAETQPPMITCPANITQSNDADQCGAVVNYPAPTVSDNCPGVGAPVCSPASGSFFPEGTTTVTCNVADAAGNTASCTFTVTVNDTQPPQITCPANVTAVTAQTCPPTTSQVVNYPAPTATDNCPMVTTICSPASGSTFPLGTTTVTCTATDMSGNTATCSFNLTVFNGCLQDDSNPGNAVLFNTFTGEYRFCCNGVVVKSGIGTLTQRGCIVTIQHNATDSRVTIRSDFSVKAGSAAIQNPVGITQCTITDRNITNNSCTCGAPVPL